MQHAKLRGVVCHQHDFKLQRSPSRLHSVDNTNNPLHLYLCLVPR